MVVPYLVRLVFHVPITIYRRIAVCLKHFKSMSLGSPEVSVEQQNLVGIKRILSTDLQ